MLRRRYAVMASSSSTPTFSFSTPADRTIFTVSSANTITVATTNARSVSFAADGANIGSGVNDGSGNFTLSWTPGATDFDVDIVPTSGTTSGSARKVVVAEANRISDFNVWTRTNFGVATSGVADPDGGTGAYTFTASVNGTAANHVIARTMSPTSTAGVTTGFQFWVKYDASLPVVAVYPLNGNTNQICYYDLNTRYTLLGSSATNGASAYGRIIETRTVGGATWHRLWFRRGDGVPTDAVNIYAMKVIGTLAATTAGTETLTVYQPRSADGVLPFTANELMARRITASSSGQDTWQTRSPYFRTELYMHQDREFYVQVPSTYSTSNQYKVLYILQPVIGTSGAYNAMTIAQTLNLHNTQNCIVVWIPWTGSQVQPWYGQNSDGVSYKQDLQVNAIVGVVDQFYSTIATREGRHLLGFSKSGWGAYSLLLRNPTIFGYAAAWDAPWSNGYGGTDYGQSAMFGSEAQWNLYDPVQILTSYLTSVNDKRRLVLSAGCTFMSSHTAMKTLLNNNNVSFAEYVNDLSASGGTFHNWNTATGDSTGNSASGWMAQIVPTLMALSN